MKNIESREFSGKTRQSNWVRLNDQFDILVVGGGITGSGIARDAAMRGFKTALLDKGDFASGTSSKSSRLIHAGVRYLELFEFGLVFEASRERRTLAHIAPTLVRPLPFLFPVYRDARWPAWMINTGLWLYDGLALFRNFGRHQMYSNLQIKKMLPGIDVQNLNGGALYYDGQVDDARLTFLTARDAARYDAIVVNYVEADGFIKEKGRIVGVKVHDVLTGSTCSIRARVVINATGPWTDRLVQLDDPHAPSRLRPTKGVHIIVPRTKVGGASAVAFPAHSDGRLMFVIPWDQFSIIGTTDTDYEGDFDRVYATAADIEYVIAAVNHAFPESTISENDVISTYAGLRPLVLQGGKSATKTSREHEIWSTESGLLTIAGGKLTTYRSMAEELVDIAARRLKDEFRIVPMRNCETARRPLVPLNGASAGEAIDKKLRDHLVRAYGSQYLHVLEISARDPRLSKSIVKGLPDIWAEVPYAIEHEMAMTVDDVLSRRTHILNEAPDNGFSVASEVAQYLADYLGWDAKQRDRQLEAFESVARMVVAFRKG